MKEVITKKVEEIANYLGSEWIFKKDENENNINIFTILNVNNPVIKIFICDSKGQLNFNSSKHRVTLLFHSFYRMQDLSKSINLSIFSRESKKLAEEINNKLINFNKEKIHKLLKTIPSSYDIY